MLIKLLSAYEWNYTAVIQSLVKASSIVVDLYSLE